MQFSVKSFGLTVLLLLLPFLFNATRVVDNRNFQLFQLDSDDLVMGAILCNKSENPNIFNSFLVIMKDKTCSMESARIYVSQFGLQGRIMSVISRMFSSIEQLPRIFNLTSALLMAIVIGLFLEDIKSRYGKPIYWMNLGLISFSVWPVLFAKSLYWATFTMFLPFVFAWIFYPHYIKNNKLSNFFAIYAALLMIRFLSGYEYFSTVALSGIVPMFFYHQKLSRKFILHTGLLIGVGILSFVITFGIHLKALAGYTGSLVSAFERVETRGKIRSFENPAVYYENYIENLTHDNWSWLPLNRLDDTRAEQWLSYFEVMIKNLYLPILDSRYLAKLGIDDPILSLAGIILLVCISYLAVWRFKSANSLMHALFKTFLVSFVPPLSWAFLAPGHMFHHLLLNGIIYFIPMILIGYLFLSVVIFKHVALWLSHENL